MAALSSEEPVSKSQISDVGRELRTKNWELVGEQGEHKTNHPTNHPSNSRIARNDELLSSAYSSLSWTKAPEIWDIVKRQLHSPALREPNPAA
jgi:hypothetical protein